jgi:hypothetical protein
MTLPASIREQCDTIASIVVIHALPLAIACGRRSPGSLDTHACPNTFAEHA